MLKRLIKAIQTTQFQQTIIFFTIFYIALMLFLQYKQSYFAEKTYTITPTSEQEARLASTVEVGMHINNFSKSSFYENSFTMDAVVWFTFAVGTESLHTIEKFSFKNGTIKSKSEPVVQIADNNVIISYQVIVQLSTPLNYKYFPVSDHKLTIILQNKTVGPAELNFLSDTYNFELSENVTIGNWIPRKQYVQSGYIKTKYKKQKGTIQTDFPSVVFTVDFENNDLRHFIILYLPLLLIFFLIFTSLLPKIDKLSLRLPIVAGVIPILALHSLVIESTAPAGSGVTKVDQLYLTLVLLSLIILLFQAYSGLSIKGAMHKTKEIIERKKEGLKKANAMVIIFVLGALITMLTYSTFT